MVELRRAGAARGRSRARSRSTPSRRPSSPWPLLTRTVLPVTRIFTDGPASVLAERQRDDLCRRHLARDDVVEEHALQRGGVLRQLVERRLRHLGEGGVRRCEDGVRAGLRERRRRGRPSSRARAASRTAASDAAMAAIEGDASSRAGAAVAAGHGEREGGEGGEDDAVMSFELLPRWLSGGDGGCEDQRRRMAACWAIW